MKKLGNLFIGLILPTVIGLLGIVASIYGPAFSEKQKELSYISTKSFPAVGTFTGNHDVKVMVGGEAVKNLRSYQVVIENTGTLAIDESDFKSPIQIVFPAHKVVGQPIVVTEPPGVGFTVERDNTNSTNSIFLNPKLLNENDKLRLSILLDGETEPVPTVSARILGLKAIRQKSVDDTDITYRLIYSPPFKRPFFLFAAVLFSFAMGCFVTLASWRLWWVASGVILLATITVVFSVLVKLALPTWINANGLVIISTTNLVLFLPAYFFGLFWGKRNLLNRTKWSVG